MKSRSARFRRADQLGQDLEAIANDAVARIAKHGRIRVAIDRDNRLGRGAADHVLARPGNPGGDVQRRPRDFACEAHLPRCIDPAERRPSMSCLLPFVLS